MNFERKQEKANAVVAENWRRREEKYEAKIVQLEVKVDSFHQTKDNLIVRGTEFNFSGTGWRGINMSCAYYFVSEGGDHRYP